MDNKQFAILYGISFFFTVLLAILLGNAGFVHMAMILSFLTGIKLMCITWLYFNSEPRQI